MYDASAKSLNRFSLNDRCLNGTKIQPDLFDIFIRWRTHKIALNADIEKMYRMIKIRPEDRKFQKILWRFSEDEPIRTYELNTVTFGTKPAPYMAIATTFTLAESEKHQFPEAAKRVKLDFYVDNCMSGSHSTQSAIALRKVQCGILSHITIIAKTTMQGVWQSGKNWDESVPTNIQAQWDIYINELPLIKQIKIKRWFYTNIESTISLHGFCDSSEKAMACVIHIIQKTNEKVTSTLVCSKTKVAPISMQSIPRLELNGAVLLAKLMDRVSRNLNVPKNSIYFRTDSSIVLTWLRSHASRWLPYVAA